jgi:polyisoprenoid-binding protein YceI
MFRTMRQARFWLRGAATGLALAAPLPGHAAAGTAIALAPPASRLDYTVFALGLFPIDANFQDFAGSLTVDPHDPSRCAVVLTVRIASLHMADPARNKLALSASVLDAARFPSMHFSGTCADAGAALAGTLTLHGVTRPLTLAVTRDGTHVTATGMLRRSDYAIGGLPGLVGQRIRFRLAADLPADTAIAPDGSSHS